MHAQQEYIDRLINNHDYYRMNIGYQVLHVTSLKFESTKENNHQLISCALISN